MMNNISEDKQSKSIGLGLVVGIAFGAGIGTAKKCLIEKNLLINIGEPVAQLVEQWPFKPLVVSSSLTRITWGENQEPLIETLGKCRGFSVSSLIIVIHSLSKSGHKYGGHTYIGVWVIKCVP